jgi:hypothetical protein
LGQFSGRSSARLSRTRYLQGGCIGEQRVEESYCREHGNSRSSVLQHQCEMTETVGLADDLEELGKLSEQEAQRLVNQLDENAKV